MRWYIKFPLYAYALGPIEMGEMTEREVREFIQEQWCGGVKRLPVGFKCWKE